MKKIFLAFFVISSLLISGCGSGDAHPTPTEAVLTADGGYGADETTSAAIPEHQIMGNGVEETAAYSAVMDQSIAVVEEMNYFTFREIDTSHSDEAGRELLIEKLVDPEFYSTDPELNEWVNTTVDAIFDSNAAFGRNLVSFAKDDIQILGQEQFYAYSHYVTMGVARHDSNIVSVLSLSSNYSGGAHPNSLQTSYNLDLLNHRVLKLEEVILESGAEELVSLTRKQIENKFSALGEDALYSDYAQIISEALKYGNMTDCWYFTEDGMVIFFNQYGLGPYAAGIIKAELSYEQLSGILLPEYYPPEHSGEVKNVSVKREPDADDRIYCVDLSEGETVFVTMAGKAEHVQYSEVSLAGQTVVGESMLFSANQISDDATFAVTADFYDSQKIYSIKYYDANGGPYVLYIHQGDIYETLPEIE